MLTDRQLFIEPLARSDAGYATGKDPQNSSAVCSTSGNVFLHSASWGRFGPHASSPSPPESARP